MRAFLLALIAVATGIAAAACGSSESTTTTQSQTVASQRYGFQVNLTPYWNGQDAQADWDGKELPTLTDPAYFDYIDSQTTRELAVVSAPTGMGLAAWQAAMQASEKVEHNCSASSSAAQTTLGGEPALAWTAACQSGRNVNSLVALHGRHGYVVLLSNPIGESNRAEESRIFESIRRSFRFTR
jgi:hypothetical protein